MNAFEKKVLAVLLIVAAYLFTMSAFSVANTNALVEEYVMLHAEAVTLGSEVRQLNTIITDMGEKE
jgi:hypothetical protein